MIFIAPLYKKKKYKHRFIIKFVLKKKTTINLKFGYYGIKATENGYLTPEQIETIRRLIARNLKNKQGKVWIRVFPLLPLPKRPAETRMGKGKSPIRKWVAPIRCGTMLFEINGLVYKKIIPILNHIAKKLPLKTMIVCKN